MSRPLTPFVDLLRAPPRRVITEPTRLTVRLGVVTHQFHRDLPPSRVWAYDGHLPGPTVEVDRGTPVEVGWENHLSGPLPVVVVRAASHAWMGCPCSVCRAGAGVRSICKRQR